VDKRIVAGIAIVITTMWAVSYLVNILNPNYKVPDGLHPLMLLVAGAAFGNAVFGKRKGDDS
jgi:hypothetical protein